MKYVNEIFCILAGLGLTLYGLLAKDVAWVVSVTFGLGMTCIGLILLLVRAGK